ncbi:MAG: DUF418 domain-containing protein [Acidobacteriota bacterium]
MSKPTGRVAAWDLIRGCAVLGILVVNMPYHAQVEGVLGNSLHDVAGERGIDWAAFAVVDFLATLKFIGLFSLLFGAGLAFQVDRGRERGGRWSSAILTRLSVLLLVGVLHGTLIWFGDILTAYAILGFPLFYLLTSRLGVRGLLVLATLGLLFAWLTFSAVAFDPGWGDSDGDLGWAAIFASGDVLWMTLWRSLLFLLVVPLTLLFFGGRLFGCMLLGAALVRSGRLTDPASHEGFFRKLSWLLPLGFGLELVSFLLRLGEPDLTQRLLAHGAFYWGSFLLALSYLGFLTRWSLSSVASGLRRRLESVGQMAFTNYLTQSILCALLFNYLGFYDRWDRAEGFLIALAIFGLQLAWSPLWLARFRQGPLEWAWRCLSQGRRLPLRRETSTPVLT